MTANPVKKWSIPDTRLPFVNTEVTEVTFGGERCLVSSVWIGAAGGRLYFWNPDTGSHDVRLLPNGIPGAYMLKEGPDGLLYIGCGNGDLICYDPATDKFSELVTGEMHSITWGGCVTDRYVVWSASPGEVGVFDWQERKLVKIFRPLDPETPASLYGHSVVEAPDGKIVFAMNSPRSKLIVLDLDTLDPVSHTPEALKPGGFIKDLAFLSEDLISFTYKNDLLFFSYPDLKLQKKVPGLEEGTLLRGKWCSLSKQYFAVANPMDTLVRLNSKQDHFDSIAENWTVDGTAAIGSWRKKSFCAVTVTGHGLRYNAADDTTDRLDLEATGLLPAHALCVAPKARKMVGAPFINQRFWTIDLETDEGEDQGRAAPGGGQINQILWDPITSRFMLSSYTSCSITTYDPIKETRWPENPSVLASARDHGQMRPMALVHDGAHLWMATSPNYGTLGGALCRVDPQTGHIDVWRNIVPEQKLTALIADPIQNRIYFSTEIFADCNSAPSTATTARLISFCTETLKVLRSDIVKDDTKSLKLIAQMENGDILIQASDQPHIWNPKTGDVASLGTTSGRIRSALNWTPDYGVLISTADAISRLRIEDGEIKLEQLIGEGGSFLQIADDKLWYASANGSHICCAAVPKRS